jgi:putative hydrolase of the HAD superfamily
MKPIPTGMARQGALKKKIQGILFDVYGTLFISASGDTGSLSLEQKTTQLQQLFQDFHLQQPAHVIQNDFIKAILAQHERMKQTGIDYPEVCIENIWMSVAGMKDIETAKEFALAYELVVNPVYPMPNMHQLLQTCRHKNLLMGIISNAQFYTPKLFRWFLKKDLTDIGFHRKLLVFSYRSGHAKPGLFLFKLARNHLAELGVSPDQVIYVGNDMRNDILPAKKIGFNTALFAGEARSLRMREDDPECVGTSPDLVITDLIQLLEYV